MYDELKTLLHGSSAIPVIEEYDTARDGRKAYIALRAQFEGNSQNTARLAQAYAQITRAKYTGETRSYNFTKYVMDYQKAHNTLAQLGAPVQEQKKVTDFIAGINCAALNAGIANLYGNTPALNDFQQAQQYLANFVNVKTAMDGVANRSIAFVAGSKSSGPNKKNKRKTGGNTNKMCSDGKTPLRGYSDRQWRALAPDIQAMIHWDRAAEKGAGSGGKPDSGEWKRPRSVRAMSADSQRIQTAFDTDTDDAQEINAGNNFGRMSQGKPKAS